MKLGQAVKMAAKSIFSNVGRSVLTMLGIIIGLAAVIILVSYAQGQNAAMRAYYESMGTNIVQVNASSWDGSTDVSKALYNYCLGLNDLVVGVTPNGQVYNSMTISYGSKTLTSEDWNTAPTVYLGNDQYGLCNDYQIARGRDLSSLDMEKLNQVCVLGAAVAEDLFAFDDPLNKTITINGFPFRVVGVYESKAKGVNISVNEENQYLLDSIKRQDRIILLPYTMTRYFNNNQPIQDFVVKVKSSDVIAETVTSLTGFLSGLKIDVLLCGGIGAGARDALAQAGIKLCAGVTGAADDAVSAYLSGGLHDNPAAGCGHHHHEHGHHCHGHDGCNEDKHGCAGNHCQSK